MALGGSPSSTDKNIILEYEIRELARYWDLRSGFISTRWRVQHFCLYLGLPQPQLRAEPEVSTPEHAMKGLSRSAYEIFLETHSQLRPFSF